MSRSILLNENDNFQDKNTCNLVCHRVGGVQLTRQLKDNNTNVHFKTQIFVKSNVRSLRKMFIHNSPTCTRRDYSQLKYLFSSENLLRAFLIVEHGDIHTFHLTQIHAHTALLSFCLAYSGLSFLPFSSLI